MSELEFDQARETQVGTWFATALVLELLIAHGVIERDEAIAIFSRFEGQARGCRRTALRAVRCMIERPPRSTHDKDVVTPICRGDPARL